MTFQEYSIKRDLKLKEISNLESSRQDLNSGTDFEQLRQFGRGYDWVEAALRELHALAKEYYGNL